MIADYYNKGTAVELMPAELKLLLSIQEASLSVPQLFPAAAATGVHLHYIHGSGAQSLYPDGGQAAYATVDTAEDDEAFAHAALAVQGVKARWNSPI
jgi:hypothetical protein